eukprot:2002399-Prorocentrum_lima.AAC.1
MGGGINWIAVRGLGLTNHLLCRVHVCHIGDGTSLSTWNPAPDHEILGRDANVEIAAIAESRALGDGLDQRTMCTDDHVERAEHLVE